MILTKYLRYLVIQFYLLVALSTYCYAQRDKIVLINRNNSWAKSSFSYYPATSGLPLTSVQMMTIGQISPDKYDVTIPTKEPLLFVFSWNWKTQFVYLFPGDTVEFVTTSNDTIPFQFSGKRPHNELMFYSFLETVELGFMSGNQDYEVTARLNYQYVADQAHVRYDRRLKLLEEQSAKGKFTDEGRNIIALSLYYQYLNELLFPYRSWKPIEEIAKPAILVPDFYKAKLNDLKSEFHKDSLIYLWEYKRFIKQYARYLMIENSRTTKIDFTSLLDFYKINFTGKIRDLLLFDEIYGTYQRSGDASHVLEVVDSISSDIMRNALLQAYNKSKKTYSKEALETQLESSSGEKLSFTELLSKNRNRLIYLDFWATWCGPCIMEMPNSKKLSEEFRNDSIEFIYISIDKDKNKWRRKIPSIPTGKNSHHYHLGDGTVLAKEMEISSIPRYILADNTGRIISSSAPRPGSEEIRKLIREEIKK